MALAKLRHEHAEEFGERNADSGDEAGLDDEKAGPAVEKAPERTIGFTQENVLAAGIGHHGRELGVTDRPNDRQDAGENPHEQQPAGGPDITADVGGNDEDARADHRAGDQHGGVKKSQLLLNAGGLGDVIREKHLEKVTESPPIGKGF